MSNRNINTRNGAYLGATIDIIGVALSSLSSDTKAMEVFSYLPSATCAGAWLGYTISLVDELFTANHNKDRQKESPLAQVSTNKPTDIQGPQY